MEAVRAAAESVGRRPFLVAKIERLDAIRHFDEIVSASDGIMIARGDLGVEVPIEEMAMLQKHLIARAHIAGKPVITATQMLESMTVNRRPTRAEAIDVANAVLDGTDAVMLSGESAIGKYPEEAVAMLAKIAAYTESKRPPVRLAELRARLEHCPPSTAADAIAYIVETALDVVPCAAVFAPTQTGTTARMISRLHPSQWIFALSRDLSVCQGLTFSYGVEPVQLTEDPKNWCDFAETCLQERQIAGQMALLVAGPSRQNPEKNHRLEFLRFGEFTI
jgi:pyruvate kinase